MIKKFAILFCLLIVACTVTRKPVPPVTHANVKRSLPNFSRINSQGDVNLLIHQDKRNFVLLKGDPRDLARVVTYVKANTLWLKAPPRKTTFAPITAELHLKFFNYLNYKGQAQVTGQNLKTSLLDLVIQNSGKNSFSGRINLKSIDLRGGVTEINGIHSENLRIALANNARLTLSGIANTSSISLNSGFLSLYWVNSPKLEVRAGGNAVVQLAGIVDRLYIHLTGSACFKGRHLNANNVFVKTYGNSVAEIAARYKQHSLASDQSDIKIFELPEMRTDFMAGNGSVLDIRDFNNPFLKEYTRYNV
jgi:hypothetical protein